MKRLESLSLEKVEKKATTLWNQFPTNKLQRLELYKLLNDANVPGIIRKYPENLISIDLFYNHITHYLDDNGKLITFKHIFYNWHEYSDKDKKSICIAIINAIRRIINIRDTECYTKRSSRGKSKRLRSKTAKRRRFD